MTEPDERLPMAGTAEPGGGEHDPERLEALAESMGIDPSPQQVEEYREALGDDGTV